MDLKIFINHLFIRRLKRMHDGQIIRGYNPKGAWPFSILALILGGVAVGCLLPVYWAGEASAYNQYWIIGSTVHALISLFLAIHGIVITHKENGNYSLPIVSICISIVIAIGTSVSLIMQPWLAWGNVEG